MEAFSMEKTKIKNKVCVITKPVTLQIQTYDKLELGPAEERRISSAVITNWKPTYPLEARK